MEPGIDSEESIPTANVAWQVGTKNRVVVPARQTGNRFLGSLRGLQIRALFELQDIQYIKKINALHILHDNKERKNDDEQRRKTGFDSVMMTRTLQGWFLKTFMDPMNRFQGIDPLAYAA
jgi:hypothetical protein